MRIFNSLCVGGKWARVFLNTVLIATLLFITIQPSAKAETSLEQDQTDPNSPSFPVVLGDAYAQFDSANQIWAIGNANIEESLQLTPDGKLQELSLRDKISGQQWGLSNIAARVSLIGLQDTTDLSSGLTLTDTSAGPSPDGTIDLRIQMNHPDSGQALTLEMSVRPGYTVIESRIILANNSGQSVRVARVDSVSLRISSPADQAWEATTISNSGAVKTGSLLPGVSMVSDTPIGSGTPENYLPLIVMRDTSDGGGIFAGLRWSTNWRLSVDLESTGGPQLQGGLHLDNSTDDSLLLASGSTIEGPWGFVGLFSGSLDDATHIVSNYSTVTGPARPSWAPLPPVTWNSWFAYQRDVNEQLLESEADLAAQLGVEVFYVDYGWSTDLGDWQPDKTRFPNGLAPLAKHVHDLGMKFGLWVAFGGATPDSVAVQQHPEFLAAQLNPAAQGIDGSSVYCLTPAQDWLGGELERIVTDYQIDWIKYDQPMIAECYDTTHGHEATSAGSLFSNNLALYNILDKLHQVHPELVIEGCFNGSGYLDYGTRRYTAVSWLTDDSGNSWTAMPKVQQDFLSATYAFRPDYLSQWLAVVPGAPAALGRTTSLQDLAYQAYSGMGGAWGLSLPLTKMDASQLALLKDLISKYKSVRPLIANGDLYHLSGPSDVDNPWGGGWLSVEYYDVQKSQGAVLYVRNGEDSATEIVPQLYGLDAKASYRVWKLGEEASVAEYTGEDLLVNGLPLSAEPRQGGWILFEQVK